MQKLWEGSPGLIMIPFYKLTLPTSSVDKFFPLSRMEAAVPFWVYRKSSTQEKMIDQMKALVETAEKVERVRVQMETCHVGQSRPASQMATLAQRVAIDDRLRMVQIEMLQARERLESLEQEERALISKRQRQG